MTAPYPVICLVDSLAGWLVTRTYVTSVCPSVTLIMSASYITYRRSFYKKHVMLLYIWIFHEAAIKVSETKWSWSTVNFNRPSVLYHKFVKGWNIRSGAKSLGTVRQHVQHQTTRNFCTTLYTVEMFHVIHVCWLSTVFFGRFLELRHAVKPSVSERPAGYPEIDDCNLGALPKAAAWHILLHA